MKRRKGFTLIEVLIVIVVIVVLASIVIPRLLGAGRQAKEASLRAHLQELRNSVGLFQSHTGTYPAVLADIMGNTAPVSGLSVTAAVININATDYKGPYLTTADGNLPKNPITSLVDWDYGIVIPNVGAVHASAGGTLAGGSDNYSLW